MTVEQRRGLIDPEHGQLSIVRRCALVSISQSSFYHQPMGETAEALALMRVIDAQFLDTPWHGSRQMVRRLMIRMGLASIYQWPRTLDGQCFHRAIMAQPEV